MGSGSREQQPRVLLRQQLRRWEWALLAAVAVVVVVVLWWIVTRDGLGSLLPMLPSAVYFGVLVLIFLRPKRVELREAELVLRSAVRTRRIPYDEILTVRGDIPSRIDWSTRLVLKLRDGRTVWVPSTREPLDVVHDLIAERIDAEPAG